MVFDPLVPIQSMNTDRDREERLIVSFEGFIKNQSEGLIRTMLSEYDVWLDIYPTLSIYDDMSMDEIYDAVSLYQPYELLEELSGGKRSPEEILKDLDTIMPQVYLSNSKITQFEIALYRLLMEEKIRYCCIYKEGKFYENEITYINREYKKVIDKIELIDETDLPVIFDKIRPTTAFITDPAFVFDYIEKIYPENDEHINDVMFILLNNTETVELSTEGTVFVYTENYKESMTEVNTTKPYGVASMFNFALQDSTTEIYDEDEFDEE